jgi:hypothetical protein
MPLSPLSRTVTKRRLKILTAIENAFDKHCIRRDDERDGNAALEADHPQSWQEIVTLCPAQREGCKPIAELDDAADIAVGAIFACMRCDIFMQAVYVTLGEWREDDLHKISLHLSRGASSLDAVKDGIGWNTL